MIYGLVTNGVTVLCEYTERFYYVGLYTKFFFYNRKMTKFSTNVRVTIFLPSLFDNTE